ISLCPEFLPRLCRGTLEKGAGHLGDRRDPGDSSRPLVAGHPAQPARAAPQNSAAVQRARHPDRRPLPPEEVTVKRETLDVKREAWTRNFCLFAFAFCLALP